MPNGKVVVISGPGGSGKNTILDMLIKELPNAVRIITATTLLPRPGEKEGTDHYFLTKDQFKQKIQNHEFLEFATVRGAVFGVSKAPVDEALHAGKIAIMEINVDGGIAVKQTYRNQAILIFINAENMAELEKRMRARGIDDEHGIQVRLSEAQREIASAEAHYDHMVINPTGHPEQAVAEIEKLIENT